MMRLGLWLSWLALVGCTPPPQAQERAPLATPAEGPAFAQPAGTGPSLRWSHDTRSPNPAPIPGAKAALMALCGEPDERLGGVAEWLVKRGSVGGYSNDIDQLTFALRVVGTPYVWPAAWSRISGSSVSYEQTTQALAGWLDTLERGPLRRCGIAQVREGEQTVLVAVVSMALADLTLALPTRARVGQWLSFEATLRVEASQAKVILLPPTGEPMSVPTQQQGSRVRARFAAATPGEWLVQLTASGETGPRPMLEALLFVDVAPATSHQAQRAPGEGAVPRASTAEQAIADMVVALRDETGRPSLRRDPTLDRLAVAHAQSMCSARRIGHDVGDGPTHQRLAAADFTARLAGENVAHATDPVRAHRALWASPSHRTNLLHRGFSRWGLGVMRDEDGSLWICEIFASDR